MRTIRVTGPLVTVEMLTRACDDATARLPDGVSVADVHVVVNGAVLGPVREDVWEKVASRVVQVLGEHVAIEEAAEETKPPPARYGSLVGETRSSPPPSERSDALQSGPRPRVVRVLIAEHVSTFRAALLAAFTQEGFEAVGVGDGARAERQIAARPPHVLIADFELPKIAGDELIARARLELGSTLEVTVLVGAELPRILVPDHVSADVVLGQPLDAREVLARVQSVLSKRNARTA